LSPPTPGLPAVEWRLGLWKRTLEPDEAAIRRGLGLAEALTHALGFRRRVVVILRDSERWAVVPYKTAPPFLFGLQSLALRNLTTDCLVVDARGQLAYSRPVEQARPSALGFAVADLGLDASRKSLLTAANFVNLECVVQGRPGLPIAPAERQKNHGGNETWRPVLAFRPNEDIEQLTDVMTFLHESKAAMVKAGGSRHSWSRAAASSQVYIHPEGMSFVNPAAEDRRESQVIRSDFGVPIADCFVVGSGTRIREVNDALWRQGKALAVLGGYDGQTLAGVVQTATHGSVLRLGPICSVVKAINLVDGQGRKCRVEPAAGPSAPAAFAEHFPGWSLRQDDDLFNAALVSVGMFGVVHSYLIGARDAFYLCEKRTRMTLTAMRELLRDRNIYRLMDVELPPDLGADDGRRLTGHEPNVYHLEFLVNPHPTDGDHTVIVTSRRVIELKGPEPPEYAHTRSDAGNLFRVLSQSKRFSRPAVSTWIAEHAPWLLARIPEVAHKLAPDSVPELLDLGMKSIRDDAFEGRSYNVFNIGQGQNSIPALSSEPSVPLRDDLYLQALDVILQQAAAFAREGKHHTGPLSMRFVARSGALLADPEDVCRFEIIFTAGTRYAASLMRAYEDALWVRFAGDVRLHWGQINNLNATTRSRLGQMFPRVEDWKRLRREYDPDGIFLNEWQRDLFLPVS